MNATLLSWIGFNLFVLVMLALDLGVFHRKSHAISLKESLVWSGVWVTLSLVFNAGLWYFSGAERALQFLTGYVIEKSLSVDNIFVFALLFTYFRVDPAQQHRVLFWGILGALVMRAVMIIVGAALMERFVWLLYVFGGLLILTGVKMLVKREEAPEPEKNPLIRLLKRWMPVTDGFREGKFFVREKGVLMATPLFLVLVLVEISDLIFAVDSIPAIFAVTTDSFIVYSSNVFAILGLRSLYFALAGMIDRFRYLKTGLGLVLTFVGVKMLLGHTEWKIPTPVSLGVIVATLAASVALSLVMTRRKAAAVGSGATQATDHTSAKTVSVRAGTSVETGA